MTYSGQFIRVTWNFTIAGTDEIANTSLNYTTVPGWTGAVAALGEMDAGDALLPLLGNMNSLISALGWADYSILSSIKAAAIGTDGGYLTDAILYEDPSPDQGTQTQTPPQLSLVASLRSGFTLGGGNYGRMYLPHVLPGMASGTPYLVASNLDDIAGYIRDFVNACTSDINADTTAVLFPAIMSNKGAGTGKGITQVGVGPVMDTQRRRRNRLDDSAVLVPLA